MTHFLIVYGTIDGHTRTRHFEYTDWNHLRIFTGDFAALAAEKPAAMGVLV